MSDPKICNYPLHVNSIEMRIYRVIWLFIMIDFNSSKKLLKNITNSKSLIYILNRLFFFNFMHVLCTFYNVSINRSRLPNYILDSFLFFGINMPHLKLKTHINDFYETITFEIAIYRQER